MIAGAMLCGGAAVASDLDKAWLVCQGVAVRQGYPSGYSGCVNIQKRIMTRQKNAAAAAISAANAGEGVELTTLPSTTNDKQSLVTSQVE